MVRRLLDLSNAVRVPLVAFALLGILTAPYPSAADDEEITVRCYKGKLDDGIYIGDLTVNHPENAGRDCNQTYIDCQGECLGCFQDTNLDRTVCYDTSGGKFLK